MENIITYFQKNPEIVALLGFIVALIRVINLKNNTDNE